MADALGLAFIPGFVMHRWCLSTTKPAMQPSDLGAPSLKHTHVSAFPKGQAHSPLAILRELHEDCLLTDYHEQAIYHDSKCLHCWHSYFHDLALKSAGRLWS